MAKITLGEKGQRLKYQIYFLGVLLLVIVGSCHICRRIDWSALETREFTKTLHELETKILLEHQPVEKQVERLVGQCSVWLRDRWLTGYLYSDGIQKDYFIGRISPEFRRAVEEQKDLIAAGKTINKKKIPKLRMVVEFHYLKCRMLVAEFEQHEPTSPGVPTR